MCHKTLRLSHRVQLFEFEDNEAVFKMTIQSRNTNMRHVSKTHRVHLDWLVESMNVDPAISIRYRNTEKEIVGMF